MYSAQINKKHVVGKSSVDRFNVEEPMENNVWKIDENILRNIYEHIDYISSGMITE